MIRPFAALVTSAALSVLGPASSASGVSGATVDTSRSPVTEHAATAAPPAATDPDSDQSDEAQQVPETDPIEVTIDGVSPSVVPSQGPITMSGRVTNRAEEPASDINIHPLTSFSPMTTTEEITAATDADPDLYWGDRIITPGSFATLARLAPGQTKRWKVTIPQSELSISGTQGVYQIGVQVRAPSEGGRVTVGRARTLIPLIDADTPAVRTSVVVPLRELVTRDDEGRLADPREWEEQVSRGGRLRNLADFVGHAGDVPVTWLMDPAVIDAVGQAAAGNPARDLDPTDGGDPEIQTSEPESDGGSAEAEDWLGDITSQASGSEVLALPYGDVDVAAASRHSSSLYERARTMSTRTLGDLDIQSRPAIVPPSGQLPTEALEMIEDDTEILLSSDAVTLRDEDISAADTASSVAVADRRVTVFDAHAADIASNLPAESLADLDIDLESTPSSPVSVRQRILSEAAVRSLSGSRESLIVNLPHDFDPGSGSRSFFTGINRSFIDLTPLATNSAGTTSRADELAYPAREQRAELPVESFTAADDLTRAGSSLDDILPRTDRVERQITAQALSTLSYAARPRAEEAEAAAVAATSWVERQLDKVTLDAPSFVILSAESGPFAVTVANGLDQPVTVSLAATTPHDVEIQAPATIELEADSSQTVQMTARTDSIGVHPVELRATDSLGNSVGSSDRLSVRSNAVGNVFWVVMGVGVGILFVAILLRWTRRIRGGRSSE